MTPGYIRQRQYRDRLYAAGFHFVKGRAVDTPRVQPSQRSTWPETPFRVDTLTDSHGTYEERWMVPPPGERVVFRVTAEAWVTELCDTCGGDGFTVEGPNYHDPHGDKIECLECVNGRRRVRVIHEWKPVEKRREL
jgi:hypothetical protein